MDLGSSGKPLNLLISSLKNDENPATTKLEADDANKKYLKTENCFLNLNFGSCLDLCRSL